MKTVALIVLALFSFLHEEEYVISDYECNNNEIKVKYEDNWYDVQLFNVFIKEDSDVCGYLKADMSFAFDSYVKIENPLNVYLFVEDKLLQQTLIEEGKATIKINNPKYKYQLETKSKPVLKEVKNPNEMDDGMTNSKKIAIGLIVAWVILVVILVVYKKRKHNEQKMESIKTQESEQKE